MNINDMDFQDGGLTDLEEQSKLNSIAKNSVANDIVKKHMAALKQELYQHGASLKSVAKANNVRTNVISQELYIARFNVLSRLIREPALTENRTVIHDLWTSMYPHFPYDKWVTNQVLGKRDKQSLREELTSRSIRKHGQLQTVGDLVRILNTHYKQQQILDMKSAIDAQSEHIKTLEIQVVSDKAGNTNSIWYRGIEIKRLSRTYKAKLGDIELIHRHSTIDPLVGFLESIDKLLSDQE